MNNQMDALSQADFPVRTDCVLPWYPAHFSITAGCPPLLTNEQEQALWQVFEIAGLAELLQPEAYETKRRCMNLAARIFGNSLPCHQFSAESLIHFAVYIDAFVKPGYIWQPTLENEANFIIQNPPHFEIDPEELLQSFRLLFFNFRKLNCAGILTLALFLLFFHRIMNISGDTNAIDWGNIVRSVIDRTFPEIKWSIKK